MCLNNFGKKLKKAEGRGKITHKSTNLLLSFRCISFKPFQPAYFTMMSYIQLHIWLHSSQTLFNGLIIVLPVNSLLATKLLPTLDV